MRSLPSFTLATSALFILLLSSCWSLLLHFPFDKLRKHKCDSRNSFHINAHKLLEVSFPYPSGLLLTPNLPTNEQPAVGSCNDIFCIVQHNIQSLRPYLQRVGMMENALTSLVCKNLISDCEKYADNNGGWTSARHREYPTTDLPINTIFGKFSSIHGLVTGNILPEMAAFFGLNEDHLSIAELFIAKYEFKAGKQIKLNPHIDGTPYSFVVTLNDPLVEFTGGGTRFIEENATYRPEKVGTAVLFSGKNKHEGVAITSGVRYILTGFCYYRNPDKSHQTFLANYLSEHDGSAAAGFSKSYSPNLPSVDKANEDSMFRFESVGEADKVDKIIRKSNGGVHTGDVLRGIRLFNNKCNVTDKVGRFDEITSTRRYNDDSAGGTMVMFEGMDVSEVQQMVRFCGSNLDGRNCTLLLERDSYDDEPSVSAQERTDTLNSEYISEGKALEVVIDEPTELNEHQRFVCKTVDTIVGNGDYWTLDSMLAIGMTQRSPNS